MEATTDNLSANLNDTLATWNVPRSIEQLRSFVSSREDAIDVEEFDFQIESTYQENTPTKIVSVFPW